MHIVLQVMALATYKISNFKLELTNFVSTDRGGILTKRI
jgi:hypothetical protein